MYSQDMTDTHEEWEPIEETEGRYSVSNMGRVRNNITGNIKKPSIIGKGYLKVNLHMDGIRINRQVHRLVAEAFIDNPENKPEVNHKNGIKTDNRLENLEWVTGEENKRHAYETGLQRHKDDRYSGYLYSVWIKQHRTNMCKKWQDFLVFREWCYENGYSDGYVVCLLNRKKGYSPDNCFISGTIQKKATLYSCYGELLTLDEISERYSIGKSTLDYRIKKGMSVEEAINIKKGRSKEFQIRVRFTESMYNYLFEKSKDKGVSVSSYIRDLVDKEAKNGEDR